MSYLIAITGKGGVGKTTLAGLLVTRLIARGRGPVLAVDADPNTCLNTLLGVEVEKTIGGVREEAREIAGKGLSVGVAKQQLLEMKIAESMVEADDFDLIAMGRPEGPGCYCYANNVLRQALGQIAAEYPVVVLDNEAGLENLSRRIVQKVDLLVLTADPSRNGLATLRRLHALTAEMGIEAARLALAVNRIRRGTPPDGLESLRAETGADFVLELPDDAELAAFAEDGRTLFELPASNAVVQRVDGFLDRTGMRAGA